MAVQFPAGFYEHTSGRRDDDVNLDEWNDLGGTVEAITKNIGVNAHGSSGSLAARLAAIEAQLQSLHGAKVGLAIFNDATTPTSKLTITADLLSIDGVAVEGLSISADITVAGAGGLDTGTESGGGAAWYAVYAIYNSTSGDKKGLLSLSFTSPTLPTGYDRYRRVGAIRNIAIGGGAFDFQEIVQEGNVVLYDTSDGQGDDGTANARWRTRLATITATAFTAQSLSAWVPITSRQAYITAGLTGTGAGILTTLKCRTRASGSPNGRILVQLAANAPVGTEQRAGQWIPLTSSQAIDFAKTTSGVAAFVDVNGYIDDV